jgi:hypothetical protein
MMAMLRLEVDDVKGPVAILQAATLIMDMCSTV